ncbi:MAG TPA: polysaccharide deacetylase family protein [Hyphomicrobiaceae bacterium]|nr:polysaccharide deacetylase family protein [Hyphomicrobiaceae bacterium]
MSRRTRLFKATLSALHFSGADSMIAPLTRGVGAILALRRVQPPVPGDVTPNRTSKVTPEFLEQVIVQVGASGFEVVSLDEAHFRLIEGDYRRPFICFTFDGAYRDTLQHAYPLFKRHNLPFTVYVATDHADGNGDVWCQALGEAIARTDRLSVKIDRVERAIRCDTRAAKEAAFTAVYRWLRTIEEVNARGFVRDLCASTGYDPSQLCAEQMMGWDEIRQLAADPLVTLGARTRRHFALSRLPLGDVRAEIEESVRRLERETGTPCRHFSYPYGDEPSAGPREFALVRELGLKTGVTGRTGLIHARHVGELTSLPRIAVSGDYQKRRYLKVLLTGAPFGFFTAPAITSSAA